MNFGLRKTGSIGIGYESGIDWDKNLRFRGVKNFIRLQMCPIDRIIMRKPNLPCTPPMDAWVNDCIQWTVDAIAVMNVASATHHRMRVTGLFCLLNFLNQLLFPKCRNM